MSACSAATAKAEVCNGEDDDCNGQTDEQSCDDKNACTKDTCEPTAGCKHALLDGEVCDADGSVCTQGDTCKLGVCVPGPNKECDDKNPCTADSCDISNGCTQVADDGKPCDADGTACTAGDVCQAGLCQKGPLTVCDDSNPCTIDKCDPKSGQCTATVEDDKVPCDDGTKCTGSDVCIGGVCKGKAALCDDDNPCTDDVCDKQKGCSPEAVTGAPCSDDNPCTIGDACAIGACKPGAAKPCVAPGPCYVASCDPISGKCVFDVADLGMSCDDGNACTSKDACDQGKCKGVVKVCDDANACTDDGCDAKSGCTSAPNPNPCNDANPCTALDKCVGGLCSGKPLDAKLDCDDGNPCTTEGCEPKSGCSHANNLAPCDDGNPCTKGDQCGEGKCQSGASSCGCQNDGDCAGQNDADLCNGVVHCDKTVVGQFTCKIKPGSIVLCDAALNTACTQQVCDAATGKCGAKALADGKGCDADGSVCTDNDNCAAGVCKSGAAVVCDDKNPCTTDICDAKLGCTYVANSAPCDADGSACTVGDSCQGKVCLSGTKILCDDGEHCTLDSCDVQTGKCLFSSLGQDGKSCDADGSVCTEADACASGKCLAGKPKDCADGNVCTDDSCGTLAGCKNVPNTKICDDGSVCSTGDSCSASVCKGQSVKCDDGNPCTLDTCNAVTGCQAANLADGVPCGSGNCSAGSCTKTTYTLSCSGPGSCPKGYAYVEYSKGCVCAPDYPAWGNRTDNPQVPVTNLVANGDGTVSDKQTLLVWAEDFKGSYLDWPAANAHCKGLTALKNADWRLPTVAELASIRDLSNKTTGLPAVFGTGPITAWTAIPSTESGQAKAWYVNSATISPAPVTSQLQVLCVRNPVTSVAPGTRFTVDADTVTDGATKLVWQRQATSFKDLPTSTHCKSLTTAGGGWRIPRVIELEGLVDRTIVGGPAIDGKVFLGTNTGFLDGYYGLYWTTTQHSASNTATWFVGFETGFSYYAPSNISGHLRCVR